MTQILTDAYFNSRTLSAGAVTQPAYTDNHDGTFTVGSGTYSLFDNVAGEGLPKKYDLAGGTFTATNYVMNYLVANYNAGSPVVQLITDVTAITETTVAPIISIFRHGTELDPLPWDTLGTALSNKTHQSIVKTQRFRVVPGGLNLSESAGRMVLVGAGVVWYGATATSIQAFNSTTDEMKLYYHVAGNWTTSIITAYNNSQYDNGTAMVSLSGSSRYAVNFIYSSVHGTDKKVYVVLGTGNYQVGDALAAQPPQNLPAEIQNTCILVGRIIVKNGNSTAYQIDSAFVTQFAPSANIQPQPPASVTKEATGFSDPEAVTVTYDSTGRTITLTGTFTAYFQGVAVTALVSSWVSDPHGTGNGAWFLFYDGTAFVWEQTPWTFDMLMIAYVYYGATNKFALRECHGLMQWQAHTEFHQTIGTYCESGGDIAGITVASTTAAERRPSVAATSVHDEDLHSTIVALADNGPYTRLELSGTGTSTFTTASTDFVSLTGSNPNYNAFATPNWVQTPMANNSWMTIWLVAVPVTSDAGSQAFRYLWLQGQTNGTLATQTAYQFSSMNLGQLATLFTEFVAMGKVILRYTGGNWDIASVEKITGTRLSNVTAPAGNYLSSVSVTAPLSGTGTVADPLTVSGGSGDLTYVHTQVTPSAAWSVTHGLGKYPSVTVVTSANDIVVGEVTYTSTSAVTITFSSAFSGMAYFN